MMHMVVNNQYPSKIPPSGEGRGFDLPLEGAFGYTRLEVTKLPKVN